MGWLRVKKINFEISLPIKGLQKGKEYNITVKDDATFIECLALIDRLEQENIAGTIFPINEGYIHNYMQLLVDLEQETIYDDVGISAYAPNQNGIMQKFNPIRDNINFNLYPDSRIQLQPDVGC
ncbi:MAG: hypothetical protein ACFE85_17310 [Candidatus Hodarchaeota archaeon]